MSEGYSINMSLLYTFGWIILNYSLEFFFYNPAINPKVLFVHVMFSNTDIKDTIKNTVSTQTPGIQKGGTNTETRNTGRDLYR